MARDVRRALVESAWDPVEERIYDIELVKEYWVKPRSRAEIEQMIAMEIKSLQSQEPQFRDERHLQLLLSRPDYRESQIQAHLSAQKTRFIHLRYRKSGSRELIERGFADSLEDAFSEPYSQTAVTGIVEGELMRSFTYDSEFKRAQSTLKFGPAHQFLDLWRIGGLEPELLTAIRAVTTSSKSRTPPGRIGVPNRETADAARIEDFINGEADDLRIRIVDGDPIVVEIVPTLWRSLFGAGRIEIEIQQIRPLQISAMRFFNADGTLMRLVRQSRFDAQTNIPQHWQSIEFDNLGEKIRSQQLQIVKYSNNAVIDEKLFTFLPPQGFSISQITPEGQVLWDANGNELFRISHDSQLAAQMRNPSAVSNAGWWVFGANLLFVSAVLVIRVRRWLKQRSLSLSEKAVTPPHSA